MNANRKNFMVKRSEFLKMQNLLRDIILNGLLSILSKIFLMRNIYMLYDYLESIVANSSEIFSLTFHKVVFFQNDSI